MFPDGAAALSTGVAAGAGMTLLVRYSDAPSAVAWRPLAGNQGPAPALVLWPTGDNNVSYRAGGYVNVSPALLAGVLCVAGQQGYRNGVADGGAISTASGTWGTIRIGAVAGYGPGFIGNVQAVAIWAETLTGDQVAAVSAAVALI